MKSTIRINLSEKIKWLSTMHKACMDFSITFWPENPSESVIFVMGRNFSIAKTPQNSVYRYFVESLIQNAIRDKDLFDLENATKKKQRVISPTGHDC